MPIAGLPGSPPIVIPSHSVEAIGVTWTAPDGQVHPLTRPDGDIRGQATDAFSDSVPTEVTTDPNPRGGSVVRHEQELERYLIVPVLVRGRTHQEFIERWRRMGDAFTQTRQLGPGVLTVEQPDGTARTISCKYMSGWKGRADLHWDWNVADALTLLAASPWWREANKVDVYQEFREGANFYNPGLTISSGSVLGIQEALNPGQGTAWPLWTIKGPTSLFTATNHRTGEVFVMDPNWDGGGALLAGETVTIRTDPVQVRGPAGEVWTGAITGDLWGLGRGVSSVEFVAAGADDGTSVHLVADALYEMA